MYVGTSSKCIETCGDGKNYGVTVVCDDGNLKSGDGCNEKCLVEKGWWCGEGYEGGKDRCGYIVTELIRAEVNEYNDILLEFSRPIKITNNSTLKQELTLNYKSSKSSTNSLQTLPYTVITPHLYMQTSFLYLKTYITEDIKGGAYLDNLLLIQYTQLTDNTSILDTNNRTVKNGTYARVWLNTVDYFKLADR